MSQLSLDLRGGFSNSGRSPPRRRKRGIDRCESPLERQLALALTQVGEFEWRGSKAHHWEVGRWPQSGLILLAQPLWAPYRPDFAIASATWKHPDPVLSVIVEVDGHEYHERTAEQAERDRSRDRHLVMRGASILRYTGREVWRDAAQCAREVFAVASRTGHLRANG